MDRIRHFLFLLFLFSSDIDCSLSFAAMSDDRFPTSAGRQLMLYSPYSGNSTNSTPPFQYPGPYNPYPYYPNYHHFTPVPQPMPYFPGPTSQVLYSVFHFMLTLHSLLNIPLPNIPHNSIQPHLSFRLLSLLDPIPVLKMWFSSL